MWLRQTTYNVCFRFLKNSWEDAPWASCETELPFSAFVARPVHLESRSMVGYCKICSPRGDLRTLQTEFVKNVIFPHFFAQCWWNFSGVLWFWRKLSKSPATIAITEFAKNWWICRGHNRADKKHFSDHTMAPLPPVISAAPPTVRWTPTSEAARSATASRTPSADAEWRTSALHLGHLRLGRGGVFFQATKQAKEKQKIEKLCIIAVQHFRKAVRCLIIDPWSLIQICTAENEPFKVALLSLLIPRCRNSYST